MLPGILYQRLPLPKKLVPILDGESLLNDASALTAYKCALITIVSGVFSFWEQDFSLSSFSYNLLKENILPYNLTHYEPKRNKKNTFSVSCET